MRMQLQSRCERGLQLGGKTPAGNQAASVAVLACCHGAQKAAAWASTCLPHLRRPNLCYQARQRVIAAGRGSHAMLAC